MRQVLGLLAVATLGFVGCAVAEMVSVVQITDMQGQVGYEVMGREELAALVKEIKEEEAIFKGIVAECKKEWEANKEANKENKLPFQGNRIKPRSVKKMGTDFNDREKAAKKRAQYEERASDKQIEEMEKDAKKEKQGKPKSDDDMAKEAAREKAFNDAFAMISKKMGEKLGRPVPAFGFAMAEGGKGEDKKEEGKKEEVKKKDEKKPAH